MWALESNQPSAICASRMRQAQIHYGTCCCEHYKLTLALLGSKRTKLLWVLQDEGWRVAEHSVVARVLQAALAVFQALCLSLFVP